MNKVTKFFLTLTTLAFIIFVYYQNQPIKDYQPNSQQLQIINDLKKLKSQKAYRSRQHKISFRYPPNYFLIEKTTSTDDLTKNSITLFKDSPENRALLTRSDNQDSDGPQSINVDIFPNSSNQTIEQWIAETNQFVKPKKLFDITLSNTPAQVYQSEGLYNYLVTIAIKNNLIYVISVGLTIPDDPIAQDLNVLVKSFKFIE